MSEAEHESEVKLTKDMGEVLSVLERWHTVPDFCRDCSDEEV